ncbi:CAP domain-containing protein, partial [Chytriomyces sp. MP71]
PSPTVSADAQAALKEHNAYRALHGIPPVVYNKTVEAKAAEYAKILAANNCKLEHGDYDGVGQNLASYEPPAGVLELIQLWEAEKIQPSKELYNHATQMLWATTTSIGCSIAVGQGDHYPCQVLVCDYFPPGNYIGD